MAALTPTEIKRRAQAADKLGGPSAAAKALGLTRSAVQRAVRLAKAADTDDYEAPTFPKGSISAPALVKRLAADARLKKDLRDAERWMPFRMRTNDPIGVVWFGDPHLGTSTLWDALERDILTCASTPGLYGANIGDVTNNWTGRLVRMYADEDISRKSERKLIKWFLAEAGVTWLLWLMGNHDEWEHGSEIIRLMDVHNKVTMQDWSAKIELVFPNKTTVRINASHDFSGHSMWNNTHAPARAPRMLGTDADLFICGHRHTWGLQQFEMPERGKVITAARARGYKGGDYYAKSKGYPEDEHGNAILTIFDPTAGPSGRVLSFVDVQQGARVLTALRKGK